MIKEITKLALGVIVVGGTVWAVLVDPNSISLQYLVGISGVIIGYYFKDVTGGIGAIFKKEE